MNEKLIIARVPYHASPDEQKRFLDQLSRLGQQTIMFPDDRYDVEFVVLKPDAGELAQAIFVERMHSEICKRAEVSDCGLPRHAWSNEQACEKYDRILDVMWNKTELDVRAECEQLANRILEAWL